jgi:hypothetical protein
MLPRFKRHIPRYAIVLALGAFACGLGNLRAQTPAPSATPAGTEKTITPQQAKAEEAAEAAAAVWLKLVANGKYAESWDTGSALFHKSITKEGWIALLKGGLPVFGDVVTRKLKAVSYSRTLPGAPDGEYVAMQYQTEFSNTKDAVETVTASLDPDGSWRISGYHIK